MEKARIAFRFGHYGDTFHGSQVQPDVPTVQGTLMHIFKKKLKWTNERMPVALASRTDSGVHVRINGGFIDLDQDRWNAMKETGFVKAVGHQLPQSISIFDARQVSSDWSPRRATNRTYRYRMECMEGWVEPNLDDFAKLCAIFEGNHDWSNYCRREPGRTTQRVIESCRPWLNSGRIIGFEIIGEAFVWNQVRRIANAIHSVVTGNQSIDRLIEARDNPKTEIDLGLAEADWLILWAVSWEDIPNFQAIDYPISAPDRSSLRWQEVCRLQQKEILIRQFDIMQGQY